MYRGTDWSFAITGPTVRNSLPDPVRNPNVTGAFFSRLMKTILSAVLACHHTERIGVVAACIGLCEMYQNVL